MTPCSTCPLMTDIDLTLLPVSVRYMGRRMHTHVEEVELDYPLARNSEKTRV